MFRDRKAGLLPAFIDMGNDSLSEWEITMRQNSTLTPTEHNVIGIFLISTGMPLGSVTFDKITASNNRFKTKVTYIKYTTSVGFFYCNSSDTVSSSILTPMSNMKLQCIIHIYVKLMIVSMCSGSIWL